MRKIWQYEVVTVNERMIYADKVWKLKPWINLRSMSATNEDPVKSGKPVLSRNRDIQQSIQDMND